MKQRKLLEASMSPHIRDEDSVNKIMWSVVIALIPAFIASLIFFGANALRLVSVSVFVAVVTEYIIRRLRKRDTTIGDGSAVITGLLLAFCVPPTLPSWMMALGAFLAIFLAKELFGGLGMNIFNPALAARAILLSAFPQAMTSWITPAGISSATPLAMIKEHALTGATQIAHSVDGISNNLPSLQDVFLGNMGGSFGETSALAIIIGGIFLISRKIIKWEVPITYIGLVFILSLMFGRSPLYEIFAGGVMLGAFFMITDMVTSPITRIGGVIFAAGCALITVLIRVWGGYPEGVCYSILIMNSFVPLIDNATKPIRLGEIKKQK